jgi:hypothetical protein
MLQATVLKQIGLLPELPCVTGPEQAAKAANHDAAPSNKLMHAAAAAATGDVAAGDVAAAAAMNGAAINGTF